MPNYKLEIRAESPTSIEKIRKSIKGYDPNYTLQVSENYYINQISFGDYVIYEHMKDKEIVKYCVYKK